MEIPSAVNAYNPNVAPPNVPEESSSSDDDLNDLIQGKAFPVDVENGDDIKRGDRIDAVAAEIESIASSSPALPPQNEASNGQNVENIENGQNEEDHNVAPKEMENAEDRVSAVDSVADNKEETDSEDDGGLAEWLISIGFKRKKLSLMVSALSDLGLDTMEVGAHCDSVILWVWWLSMFDDYKNGEHFGKMLRFLVEVL